MKNKIDTTKLSPNELLSLFANILEELKSRGIARSNNNPVADYSEWIVSKALGLVLQPNSKEGFDAKDTSNGLRYQIKGRRLHSSNSSRQLGVIRNLSQRKFDFLIALLFDKNFSILEAYKIPHKLISKHARYSKHVNGHILTLKREILTAKSVERIDNGKGGIRASLKT